MTHDEAMQGHTISRAEAIAEVRNHNHTIEYFINECGDHQEYNSRAVLEWLGY